MMPQVAVTPANPVVSPLGSRSEVFSSNAEGFDLDLEGSDSEGEEDKGDFVESVWSAEFGGGGLHGCCQRCGVCNIPPYCDSALIQ